MKLIDLSREIHHKAQRLPNHPTIEIYPFSTHAEKRVLGRGHFLAMPLKIKGGTGSPVRAVASLEA